MTRVMASSKQFGRKPSFSYILKRYSSKYPLSLDIKGLQQIHVVNTLLNNVCDFLLPFLSIVNCHTVHFFSHRHWESKIPLHLRTELEEIAQDEGRTLMRHYFSLDRPLSGSFQNHSSDLESILSKLRSCTTPSLLHSYPDIFDPHGISRTLKEHRYFRDDLDADDIGDKCRAEEGNLDPRNVSPRGRRKCISDKKRHEVDVMGSSLLHLRWLVGFDTLVDVGCGLGHLEEELRLRLRFSADEKFVEDLEVLRDHSHSYPRNPNSLNSTPLNVIGIEGNEALLRSAHARRSQLFGNYSDWHNVSVAATISRSEELTSTLKEVLDDSDERRAGWGTSDNRHFLCGLHACGGLTSSILKSYIDMIKESEKSCAGFFVVGCCHHKISERRKLYSDAFSFPLTYLEEEKEEDVTRRSIDFPLSQLLRERDFVLGQNARMSANQPLGRIQALGRKPPESLFLSAVLDVILRELYSTVSPPKKLGRKIGKEVVSEVDFLKKGLEKHGFDELPSDGILREYLDRFGAERGRVFTFYEFRSLLGAIVETVVVLDRFLFLLESGAVSKLALIQAFDPVVSPRCCALVGLT